MAKETLIKRVSKFLEDRSLANLSDVYQRSRGLGNTHAMMKVAKETGAIVVFALHSQAEDAKKRYPDVRCVSLLGMQNEWGQEPVPVLFDNAVWPVIFGRLRAADELLGESKSALETVEQMRRSMIRVMNMGGDAVEM